MNFKNALKSAARVLLVLAMLMSLLTLGIFAAQNEFTVRIAAFDGMTGTFVYAPQKLTVPSGIAAENGFYNAEPGYEVGGVDHGVEEGEITALDAIVAAHISAYGDTASLIGNSSYITGMFGIEGNLGFSADGKIPVGDMSDGYAINEYVLRDGETILFFNYADPYTYMFGDYTSYFDIQSKTVAVDEEFELTLICYQAMEAMGLPGSETPALQTLTTVSGADVCTVEQDGSLKSLNCTTDENGKVALSFETAGEYIISASGYVFDSTYGTDTPIIAPLCFVTVSGDEEEKPDLEPDPVPLNRIEINEVTSNGSLDYVDFKDAKGNAVENAELSIDDKSINVVLSKDYDISGKVTAEFSLTQNTDGLPYVTPKNKATGTSSGKAWNNRTNTYTTTLSKGAGKQTVYFYNLIPGATTNNYETYIINYKVKNELPKLADGISPAVTFETIAGTAYTVNLDEIFTDSDEDTLTYQVKINNETAINAESNYSFTAELGGEYVLVFSASDGKDIASDTYTVTLTVTNSTVTYDTSVLIPEGIVPEFYITNGYGDNRTDVLGDELVYEIGEPADGFVTYTVKVPENIKTVSVRAVKDSIELGGMSIPVSENSSVQFREVYVFIPTKANGSYVTAQQISLEVADKDGNSADCGTSGTDADGILYYTFFLAATGNERLYTFYAKPLGDIASVYATTQADNKAIAPGDASAYESSVELGYKSAFKLNVPADAQAKAFYQNKNYNVSELTPLEIKEEADGTKTYYFHVTSGSDAYSYRVSCDGKITKAGYISASQKKVTWSEEDYSPDAHIEYDKTTTFGSRADDSLLLNVNSQNRLILAKGETFKLRAYRIWQIINNDTMNKMIEPDFNYTILSGSDIISITPVTSGNGNAKNNRLNITATGEGTAILEIDYDALDIISGNTSSFNGLSEFTFGACDSARKGLVVIQTANAATDVDFGIISAEKWDAEFDTLYFTGEYGTINFVPIVTDGSISKVEFSNDNGKNWSGIEKKDDLYTAKIVSGNNLLRVTKEDGTTSYQVVRGDKITVAVTNITNPEEKLGAGDTARISLYGVHFPMGKMSGIYNPGFNYGHKLTYTMGEAQVQSAGSFQYNFPTNAYLDITIPEDAKDGDSYTLTNGYIYFNNLGGAPGEHRNITDNGASANMGASGSYYSRCILPDITITLETENVDSGNDSDDDGDGAGGDNGEDNTGGGTVGGNTGSTTKPDKEPIDVSNLKFDISGSEIKGYVTVSFEDFAERKPDESGIVYKNQLGEIIKQAEVPFKNRDTVASVTLRLLKALDITASYTGSATSNFYLSSIGNFTLNGKYYSSFGEFDAGAASGWMIKHNNWFINMGASEFAVQDGDTVEWLYTCQLGADIGCDWSNPSAEITEINFKSSYGTLSPVFDNDVEEYTYTVSSSISTVCLEAVPSNYWSKVTYKSGDKIYKTMEEIPVSDGTVIIIESSFAEYAGSTAADTDSVKITIRKSSGGGYSGSHSSEREDDKQTDGEKETDEEQTKENTDTSADKNIFTEKTFSDINKNDWHYGSVKYVYENNLMQGTGDGFEPESKMTRAMLVTVLYRMTNPEEKVYEHSFEDVSSVEWYSEAVAWASENNIVNGVGENEFAPNENVTREQMALIIYRYAKIRGFDVSGSANLQSFTDANDISDWALDAVKWAKSAMLINGTSNTELSPKYTATRAQVAAVLMRFCENIAK